MNFTPTGLGPAPRLHESSLHPAPASTESEEIVMLDTSDLSIYLWNHFIVAQIYLIPS